MNDGFRIYSGLGPERREKPVRGLDRLSINRDIGLAIGDRKFGGEETSAALVVANERSDADGGAGLYAGIGALCLTLPVVWAPDCTSSSTGGDGASGGFPVLSNGAGGGLEKYST